MKWLVNLLVNLNQSFLQTSLELLIKLELFIDLKWLIEKCYWLQSSRKKICSKTALSAKNIFQIHFKICSLFFILVISSADKLEFWKSYLQMGQTSSFFRCLIHQEASTWFPSPEIAHAKGADSTSDKTFVWCCNQENCFQLLKQKKNDSKNRKKRSLKQMLES